MKEKNNPYLLSQWYLKNQRDLPWRRTKDPYLIWISEVMLQQTQVKTVIPYYEKFIAQFPNIKRLAQSSLETVYSYWSGLGYYSRAKNIHLGAIYIFEKLQNHFPKTYDALIQVPGIGPYTAGAILSIAFNQRVAIVDGNIKRVFARFYGITEPIDHSRAVEFFWSQAKHWVNDSKIEPTLLNQALMELGATVCIKSNPHCLSCPIRSHCIAFLNDKVGELPVSKEKKSFQVLNWVGLIVRNQDSILLNQFSHRNWWKGLWNIPLYEFKNIEEKKDWIEKLSQQKPSLKKITHRFIKHSVTHFKIRVEVYEIDFEECDEIEGLEMSCVSEPSSWYSVKEMLNPLPLSALTKKILLNYQAMLQ